jgi:hypothetical protein
MAVLSPCSGYNFESTEILPHSALDKKTLMPEANWPKIMLFRRSFDAMELSTTRTFQAGDSPKEAIPYSSEADCQATRDRNAIYASLAAVFALVSVVGGAGPGDRPSTPGPASAAIGGI